MLLNYSKTQSVMVTVASIKELFTYFQRDGVNNHTYYREFMAQVETFETYGGLGAICVIPVFITAKMKELAASGAIADIMLPLMLSMLMLSVLLEMSFWAPSC